MKALPAAPGATLPAFRLRSGTGRFLARALPALAVVVALGAYLGARFAIGVDDQVHRCLPPYRVFLVDRRDRAIPRGALVAFHARGLAPYFADGTVVIKAVAGVPGDRVEVTPEVVRVNGKAGGEGLALARTLGKRPEDFVRTETVPPGHLWVMGASPDSFDARYWGMLPETQVVGRAYALF